MDFLNHLPETNSIIFWVASSVAVLSAFACLILTRVRQLTLALWFCGLGTGGLFLSMGMEFLAITQWFISTLVTVSLIFSSVLVGNSSSPPRRKMAVLLFTGVIIVALSLVFFQDGFDDLSPVYSEVPLRDLGTSLIGQHLISIELIVLTFCIAILGLGVMGRQK